MSRRARACMALAAFAWSAFSFAQGGPLGADRAVPPTPSPVGAGARPAGMANAFIAIADDASAASWNPAGLVQLERPEFSLVMESFWARDGFTSSTQPEIDGAHAFDGQSLNFMSFVYPVRRPVWGRNVVLALSYQRRYDFTRQFDARLLSSQVAPGGGILGQDARLKFDQHGGLGALVPSVAFEVTKTFSVGASLNLWRSDLLGPNGWEQTTHVDSFFTAGPSLSMSSGFSRERYEDIHGESITLGLLWHATDRLSLGARYDSSLRASAKYSAIDRDLRLVPDVARPIVGNIALADEERTLRFPDTWALGMAYRFNDRLTLALDVSQTDWDKATVETGDGDRFSLIDGADQGNPLRRTEFDPTIAVRLGAEYLFIPRKRSERLDYLWSLRGGLFLEQEPASGRDPRSPFRPGDGEPDNFYGFTLGAGLLFKQRVNIDLAYQYRFGDGVNGDLNPGVTGFNADEDSHRFVLSTVLYF